MAHAGTLPARRDVLFHQDVFTLAMIAMLLAAGVLFTGLWGASQLLGSSYASVGTTLSETALVLDHHADELATERAADAAVLRALATRLRQDAQMLGDDPASNTYAGASLLAAKAAQLDADADAIYSRGAAVGDMTMMDAAEQLREASSVLSAAADQMRGMLRR